VNTIFQDGAYELWRAVASWVTGERHMSTPENPSLSAERDRARAKLDQQIAENAGLLPSEVALLRKALHAARDAMEQRRTAHLDVALPSESHLADEMDLASRDQDMGFALLLAGKDQSLAAEVEAALARMADGSYGLCEGCDEPIGFRRLEARPWTRYSVGYQEQLERDERSRAAR
jgi:DnaK suppressor protein